MKLKGRAKLEELLLLEANKRCVDCNEPSPRWASVTLGIFICMRCSHIHKGMGVSVSRVKSLATDHFSKDNIKTLTEMGNEKAKLVYEFNVPDDHPSRKGLHTDMERERWIWDKYVYHLFMRPTERDAQHSQKKRYHILDCNKRPYAVDTTYTVDPNARPALPYALANHQEPLKQSVSPKQSSSPIQSNSPLQSPQIISPQQIGSPQLINLPTPPKESNRNSGGKRNSGNSNRNSGGNSNRNSGGNSNRNSGNSNRDSGNQSPFDLTPKGSPAMETPQSLNLQNQLQLLAQSKEQKQFFEQNVIDTQQKFQELQLQQQQQLQQQLQPQAPLQASPVLQTPQVQSPPPVKPVVTDIALEPNKVKPQISKKYIMKLFDEPPAPPPPTVVGVPMMPVYFVSASALPTPTNPFYLPQALPRTPVRL